MLWEKTLDEIYNLRGFPSHVKQSAKSISKNAGGGGGVHSSHLTNLNFFLYETDTNTHHLI